MVHELELVAKLNTNEAQQKLDQLRQKQSKDATDGPASNASKGIDELADSLKKLKSAIGGSVLVHGFGQMAKNLELLGKNTDEIVNQFTGSFNRLLGAIQSGNPVIMAVIGAIEAFNIAWQNLVKPLQKAAEEAQKSFEEQDKRGQKWSQFRNDVTEYRQERRLNADIESGDINAIKAQKEVAEYQRSIKEQSIQTGMRSGWSKDRSGSLDGLLSEVKKYDDVIDRLNDALKKQTDAQQKAVDAAIQISQKYIKATQDAVNTRVSELESAKSKAVYGEQFQSAVQSKDTAWLEDALYKAVEAMGNAQTASEYNLAYGQAKTARDALRTLARDEQQSLQQQLQSLTGIQSPVSNFTAAGFSMGEQFSTVDNISKNVDEIVRLMREQMLNANSRYGAILY